MYEKQMELFEDGGLRDEGGMVDEESGNEVPVGSTRKEVRDDIPAMLSEGEFVFPADVVRYIGLENLMRIRQDAKQGLKQMEAMGQMGNGDEAVLPDDMPFGMMDLIIIEGEEEEEEPQKKARGGVIHAQQGTFVTPMFDPSNQDVREYKNEAGDSLFIPFLGGEPVYPIPAGYFPAGQMPTETEAEAAPVSGDDDGGTPPPEPSEFQKAGGFGMDTSATDGKALDMWIKEAEKVSTFGNVAAGIGAAINPLMGGMIAMANKRQKKEIIEMLDEKIAQARKTPIEGQVAALQDIKKRLTTKEGKGILAQVLGGIVNEIKGAVGLSEEEANKATGAVLHNAGQDPTDNKGEEEEKKEVDEAITSPESALNRFEEEDARKIREQLAAVGEPDLTPKPPETPVAIPISSYDEVPTRTDIENALAQKSTAPEAPQIATPAKLRSPMLGEGDLEQAGVDAMPEAFRDQDKIADALGSVGRQAMKQPKFEAPIPPQYQQLKTALDELRESTPYRGGDSGMTLKEKIEDPMGTLKKSWQNVTDAISEVSTTDYTPPTQPTSTTVKMPSDDDDGPSLAEKMQKQMQEQATKSLDTFDENVGEVVSKAKTKSAQKAAKQEAEKVKEKLEQQAKGIKTGFKKGGLASRKK